MSPIDTGGQGSPKGEGIPERYKKKRPFGLPYAPYNPITGKFHIPNPDQGGGGGTTAIMAEIVTEVNAIGSPGLYTFKLFQFEGQDVGEGPPGEDNECRELNSSTGILPGTKVVCHQANDDYWFFFPVETCF